VTTSEAIDQSGKRLLQEDGQNGGIVSTVNFEEQGIKAQVSSDNQ